jgi:RimJ/RimL family protein N-acetyltransferase
VNTREAKLDDAERLVKLIQEVEKSSDYMLFEAGERTIQAEQFRKRIESLAEGRSTIFVAEDLDELVGYLMVITGNANRAKHSAYLVIGISERHRGKGIGTKLFAQLDEWVKVHGIHRLELTVMVHNNAGVALYKKAGFEIEGVKKHSLLVNGEYVDEYYMAKLV